jgi:hypothetical protein
MNTVDEAFQNPRNDAGGYIQKCRHNKQQAAPPKRGSVEASLQVSR